MIKLIPEKIISSSTGEIRVFNAFKSDFNCADYIVIHSLFISKHIKRFSGEIDFVVIAPGKGVFLLEVKHGEIWREVNGDWFVRNQEGKVETLKKSPFEQLSDTMFSFKHWLNELLDNERVKRKLGQKTELLKNLEFGYGVMFTSASHFDALDPGWEDWMIFTKSDFRLPISRYINRLTAGFDQKWKGNIVKPDQQISDTLISLIRGDFHIHYELLNRLNDTESLIDEMNKEQSEILDLARINDRCLFQGPAGSGKTVLAVELFAEFVERGTKTAIFCYNRRLADNLKNTLQQFEHDGSYVGTLDAYLLMLIGKQVPDNAEQQEYFFKEELPYEFMDLSPDMYESLKFDYIIVDEAQDLLTDLNLEIFDLLLKGGLKSGKWSMFGDFHQQALYINNPAEALRILSEKTGFVRSELKYNCRNTRKIGNKAASMTLTKNPLYRPGTPEGDDVDFYFPATFTQKVQKIEEILDKLIQKQQLPTHKIAILAPRNDEIARFNSDKINNYIKQGVTFCTIFSYKGLENSVVILTGFTSLLGDNDQRLLYVGLTRPRSKLILVLDKHLDAEREQLYLKDLSRKLTSNK